MFRSFSVSICESFGLAVDGPVIATGQAHQFSSCASFVADASFLQNQFVLNLSNKLHDFICSASFYFGKDSAIDSFESDFGNHKLRFDFA
jgi:hypothetical protein